MKDASESFVEVCIYEVKPEKIGEFERLIERVAGHHRDFPGVRDVRYMKRTHRPADFSSARKGKPAIRLTRKPRSVTYVLYWELDNEVAHGRATKSGLEHFFRDFARCLVTTPKMILGERIQ
jgi:heme-degrading monooxygenase HmoA